jgi:hypothetical protein
MSRSRSSFDLSGAIATAASLTIVAPEDAPRARYRSVPLVSFSVPPPAPPGPSTPPARAVPHELEDSSPELLTEVATMGAPPQNPPRQPTAPAPIPVEVAPVVEEAHGVADAARRPPKLPDLSEIKSPVVRCTKIIEWIVEAVGASEVFIADAAGLPIAGAIADAEARLAATGVVASAVAHLAAAIPGNSSALFEMHVGEGPFFQLIGFEVGTASYVVGFHRSTPLGFRQAHAVRLACRHALGLAGPVEGQRSEPGYVDPHPPGARPQTRGGNA